MAAETAGAAAPAVAREAGAHKGVLLAIAILLLWLAGLCFFIALEGSQLLGEAASPTGGGLLKAIITGIAGKALAREQAG